LILPEIDQGNVYNALNLNITLSVQRGNPDPYAGLTVWVTVMNVWLCPSDGDNGDGLWPVVGTDGRYPTGAPPVDPSIRGVGMRRRKAAGGWPRPVASRWSSSWDVGMTEGWAGATRFTAG
jgi:hypothetical protein